MVKAKPLNKIKLSNKKIALIAVAIAAVIAVVVGIVFLVVNNGSSKEETRREAIVSSPTYTEIVKSVTVDKQPPASVIIAPASQAWWDSLKAFSPLTQLDALDYSSLSKEAVYISYTVSKGGNYSSNAAIGVPTTLITYSSKEDAEAAMRAVPADLLGAVVSGNNLIIAPLGAFSDLDYTISKLDSKIKGEDPLSLDGEAFWQISLEELEETSFPENMEDNDKKVYNEILTKIGFVKDSSEDAEPISWTGYSKDGLTWNGKFSGFDPSKFVGGDELVQYIGQQRAFVKNDGSIVYGTPPSEEEDSGVAYPKQSSLVECCIVVATKDKITQEVASIPKDSPFYSKLKADEGIIKFVIDPNQFFATLIQVDTYPFSQFGTAEIIVKDADGNARITLEQVDWNENSLIPEEAAE